MVAGKKTGTLAVTTSGAFLLFWVLGGAVHADDRAFLHRLSESVCVDDKNLLGFTGESGYVYDKNFLDFPGGSAYTGGKTFLGFDGHLENKSTGKAIPDAIVTLAGVGLPPRTRADSNGNLRASSTSSAEEIRVVIKVAGYQPYSIIVLRREKVSALYQNVMPTFLLTPLPPLPHARSAKGS